MASIDYAIRDIDDLNKSEVGNIRMLSNADGSSILVSPSSTNFYNSSEVVSDFSAVINNGYIYLRIQTALTGRYSIKYFITLF